MKPNDTSQIAKLKYFRIERIEHGMDTNFPTALVFAYHRQQCPIAISVEFADAAGNTIPVTKSFARQSMRFLDYDTGQRFGFGEVPPDIPTSEKCQIATTANEFEWDEAVIKEVQALYGDVEDILKRMPEMQSPTSVNEAIDQVFSEPPLNARSRSGSDEYVDSPTLPGHRWEVGFLKQSVAYELSRGDRTENPGSNPASGIPFAAARAIIQDYDRANPDGPALSPDGELGPSVTQQVRGVDVQYIQYGGQLYPEEDLRFAVKALMDPPPLDDDPPRPRQRVEFYLYCQTMNGFRIAADIHVGGSMVTTVHPENPGDDGYGKGLGLFNSAVSIIPVEAYRPSPPHPGFKNCVPGTNRLAPLDVGRNSPLLSFKEYYIELWLGHRHFESKTKPSLGGSFWISDKANYRVRVGAAASYYPEEPQWSANFYSPLRFSIPGTLNVIGTVTDLIDVAAGDPLNYAKGRILIGTCSWRNCVQICTEFDQGRVNPVTDKIYLYLDWVDMYGTRHIGECVADINNTLIFERYIGLP